MNEIYVSGHRNPDTDSIVASMAYAKLRNALGDREYKAVRIGAINDETQHMLDHFGFEPPEFIKSMRTQVRDLDFDRPPELNCSVTMDLAWRTMREGEIATMPIVNDDGRFTVCSPRAILPRMTWRRYTQTILMSFRCSIF